MRFLFVCFLLLWLPVQAEQKTLTWYTSEYYPCHLATGPDKGDGYCDLAIRDAIQMLPDYQHVLSPVTSQRALALLQGNTLGCALQFFKTPQRQEFLYFSEAAVDVLPNGIMIWHDDVRFESYIDQAGRISLAEVAENHSLVFGREASRSYGPILDNILNTEDVTQIESTHDIFYETLLRARRVDYVIGYPYEKFGKVLNIENSNMRFIPIRENPTLYQAHFSCSKTDEGKAIIDTLNAKLKDSWRMQINNYYERWLPPAVFPYYRNAMTELTAN